MPEEEQRGEEEISDQGEQCVECGARTSAPHAWGGRLCDHCAREAQE